MSLYITGDMKSCKVGALCRVQLCNVPDFNSQSCGICLSWYFKQVTEISAERITCDAFVVLLSLRFEIPDCFKQKG